MTEEDPESIDTRKLQIVGGSTYALSLPKAWVEDLGLEKGDELHLRVRPEGDILVEPRGDLRPQCPELVLETTTADEARLVRQLTGLYMSGVRLLRVRPPHGVTRGVRRATQEACQRLKGLQLVEETDDQLVVQDLEDPHELDMARSLRMMHLHAQRMLEEARTVVASPSDASLGPEMERCEAELDRLLILLIKHHNLQLQDRSYGRTGGFRPEESLYVILVAQYLERVGDYADRVAKAGLTLDPSGSGAVNRELAQDAEEASTLVERAFEAFIQDREDQANAVVEDALDFVERVRCAGPERIDRRRSSDPDAEKIRALFTLSEAVERIALYGKSLAEFSIDKALGRSPQVSPEPSQKGDGARLHQVP